MYEVTIRNRWGDKIVRRVEVDDLNVPLSAVLDQGLRESRTQYLAQQFISKCGRSALVYFWFPDRIPEPPPPPPKPEPVGFDTLVNVSSV